MSVEALKAAIQNGQYPDFTIPGWSEQYPLFNYQRAGVCWLYLTPKALLLDQTGTGKTAHGLGLLQYLKSKGDLSPIKRALIVCPAISVYGTWEKDGVGMFVPDMNYVIGRGTPRERKAIYADPTWEVMITNYEMVRQDIDEISKLGFDIVIMDEADYVRNPKTKAHRALKRITENATRVVAMTATPIQTQLMDLHGLIAMVGLESALGNAVAFSKEYHKYKMVRVYYGGRSQWTKKLVGHQNVGKLKERLSPFYLRRTYRDIDVEMPDLVPRVEMLEMSPYQKQVYRDVQSGYLDLGPGSSPLEIKAAALRLRQVCTTPAALGLKDDSCKLDWLMDKLKGDWANEKVIVFSNWLSTLDAFELRLAAAGIGFTTITGRENSQVIREERRQRFWNDPECKVLLGTTAIEKSLNLQVARLQINLDMLYNASRHHQLAGRVQRIGSKHKSVYVFSLITAGTIEEGIMKVLEQRQALSDTVLDEESELFDALTPAELLKLISS